MKQIFEMIRTGLADLLNKQGFSGSALGATLLALLAIACLITMAKDIGSWALASVLVVALLVAVIGIVAILVNPGRPRRDEEPR